MTDLTLSAELRSRRYLLQSYQKRVLSTDQHARYVEKQYMHKLAVTVLCQLMPHLRLNETIVYVIGQNISQNPQWNMLIACENMKHLEKYAWNLIDFPWKKEFLTIKTYSGFYKTHIEPHMSHAECLFGLLGYKLNHAEGQFEITESTPMREHLAAMAFEFYIASVECEICHAISCKFDDDVTDTANVYHYRSRYKGTISSCIQHLQKTQNIHISQHHSDIQLTATDYPEPVQPVTAAEFSENSTADTDRYYEIKSCSAANGAKKCSAAVDKIFMQPSDDAVMSNILCGPLREVPKDGSHESYLQSRPAMEMCEMVNKRGETWACSFCTFVNERTINICEMCFSSQQN